MWKWLKSWFVRKPVEVPVAVKAPFVRPLTPFEDAYNRAKLSGEATVNLSASLSSASRNDAEIVLAAVYGIGGVGGGGWVRADDTGRKNIETPGDMPPEDQIFYAHVRKTMPDDVRARLFQVGGMQRVHEAILEGVAKFKVKAEAGENQANEAPVPATAQESNTCEAEDLPKEEANKPNVVCVCRQCGKTEAVDRSIKQKALLEALGRVKKQVYAMDEAVILARNAERAKKWAEHAKRTDDTKDPAAPLPPEQQVTEEFAKFKSWFKQKPIVDVPGINEDVLRSNLEAYYQFLQSTHDTKNTTPDPSAPPPRRQQTSGGEVGVDASNVEGTAPDVGVPPMDGRSGTQ